MCVSSNFREMSLRKHHSAAIQELIVSCVGPSNYPAFSCSCQGEVEDGQVCSLSTCNWTKHTDTSVRSSSTAGQAYRLKKRAFGFCFNCRLVPCRGGLTAHRLQYCGTHPARFRRKLPCLNAQFFLCIGKQTSVTKI